MAKVFAIIIIKIIFLGCIHGQSFEGGISAGMTASEVSGDMAAGPNKLGFSLGVFTALKINSNFKIQLEMMYIQKGSKVNPTDRNGYREYRFHLEYVEVPLLYKFVVPLFSHIEYIKKLEFELGISYARLLRYKELAYEIQPQIGVDVEDFHYNETNLLLGFLYPISEKLNFNFRFSNSITPIRPHKGKAKLWYNWGQYHTLWNLSLAYSF